MVHAVRLGALQQRDVLHRAEVERVEDVAQHRCVPLHQLLLVPARQQARTLLERGVDEVGDPLELAEHPAARCGVREVEGEQADPGEVRWQRAGHAHHVEPTDSAELLERRVTDQPRRAGNENSALAGHALTDDTS